MTQISGPPPVDPDQLATASQQLLDQLPISDNEPEALQDDAEVVLGAAAEPDQDRLRSRGRSMAGVLGRVGTARPAGRSRSSSGTRC